MSVVLESLAVDLQAEAEGRWVPVPEWPGVSFFVRNPNYPEFVTARAALELKWAEEYEDTVPEEVSLSANADLAVKYLLLDWRGFVDKNKQPIPFTSDKAKEILMDPAYRKVRLRVYLAATTVGQKKIEVVSDAAKNSAALSGSN